MSNSNHYHPPSDDRNSSNLPSLFDISLRELLDKHSQEPALLHQILVCKAEEDKVKAEELRYRTEIVRLEIRRLENEAMKDMNHSPKLGPSISQIKPNLPSVQPNSRLSGVTSLNQYALTSYPEASSNGVLAKASPAPSAPKMPPPENVEPMFSHRRESIDNRQGVSTIQLRSIPAPYYTKRSVSRGEVLEALRNKVLNNNRNRNGPSESLMYKNTLPPMQEQLRTSPEEGPYHNAIKEERHSGSQQDSHTTLSNLQPRDFPQDSNTVGPFSAPVGGPHITFRYPPPTTESQTYDPNDSR